MNTYAFGRPIISSSCIKKSKKQSHRHNHEMDSKSGKSIIYYLVVKRKYNELLTIQRTTENGENNGS